MRIVPRAEVLRQKRRAGRAGLPDGLACLPFIKLLEVGLALTRWLGHNLRESRMDYEKWEKLTDGEFLKFDRIPDTDKYSRHPDLCAMMYLENIGATDEGDMIAGAEHDIAFLAASCDNLTDDDAIYLARCGVHWDSEFDSGLAFFT